MLYPPPRLGDWGGGNDNPHGYVSWVYETCLAKSVFKTGSCSCTGRGGWSYREGQTAVREWIQYSLRDLFNTMPLLQAAQGEEYRTDMGVAFTVLGGPRPVRYLGLNLMNSFPGVGIVTISLFSYPW
jgi:hypothetical protein